MGLDERGGSSPGRIPPALTHAPGGGSVAHWLPASDDAERTVRLGYPYWIPVLGWLLLVAFGAGLAFVRPDDLATAELWMLGVVSLLFILVGVWFVIEGHRFSVLVGDRGLVVRFPLGARRAIAWRDIVGLSFSGVMHAVYLRLANGNLVRVSLMLDGVGLLLHRLHAHTPPAVHGTLFSDVEAGAPDAYQQLEAPTPAKKLAVLMVGGVFVALRVIYLLPFEPTEIRIRSESVASVVQQVPPPAPASLPGPARAPVPAAWRPQDALRFRELMVVGAFDSIAGALVRLRADAMADVSAEQRYYDAFTSFWDTTTKSAVDLWVIEHPASLEARLVRTHQLVYLAFERRGGAWASETSPAQFRAMEATLDSALGEAREALTLDPNALAAYWALLRAAQTPGPTSHALAPALRLSPASLVTRARAIMNHLPRWGGSYEAMSHMANQAEPYVRAHPALRTLHGLALWDEARVALRADDTAAADGLLRASLRYGPSYYPCLEMAKFLWRRDRGGDAVPYAECAAAARPSMAEAQLYLGQALYDRARAGYPLTWSEYYPRAREAAFLAYQLDPADDAIKRFWDLARDPFRRSRERRAAQRGGTAGDTL